MNTIRQWVRRHNFALLMLWGVALETWADYCTLNDTDYLRYYGLIVGIWVAVTIGRTVERRYWQPKITRLKADIDHAQDQTMRAYQLADRRISEVRAEFERRSQP
jgi:hypothetical protein